MKISAFQLAFAPLALAATSLTYGFQGPPGNGYCLRFDGVDGVAPTGQWTSPTDHTIELWIRQQGPAGTIAGHVAVTPCGRGYALYLDNQGSGVPTYNLDKSPCGGAGYFCYGTPGLGVWKHLAGTFDSASNKIRLYENGVLVDEQDNCTTAGCWGSGDTAPWFAIGAHWWGDIGGYAGFVNADLDELRLWDYARTQAEIVQEMNNSLLGTESGLIGYWPFEEGTGSTTADLSAGNHFATLAGGVSWQLDDCNGNGIPDWQDIADRTSADCNSNGIPDECEIADDPNLDCDGNGVLDSCEWVDCDGNLVLDTCDIAGDPSLDCDLDGVLDSCQLASDPSLDCDGNLILDTCDIANDPSLDQNGDGILDSCQCAFGTFCFSTSNSTGVPATIGWSGSASISAADLTLTAKDLPTYQFAMFFYGAEEWFPAVLGDGLLCVAPPLYRIRTAISTGPNGTVALLLDYDSKPLSSGKGAVAAFSTWRFQLWYRDPFSGGAGSNTTDGLMVTFCP